MQYTYNKWLTLLKGLNDIFKARDKYVALNIYGGFVMCAYAMRLTTEDIDAVIVNSEKEVHDAVKLISKRHNIKENWFKSEDICLIYRFRSDKDREYLFFFAPQQFMGHNVFYDKCELEVL